MKQGYNIVVVCGMLVGAIAFLSTYTDLIPCNAIDALRGFSATCVAMLVLGWFFINIIEVGDESFDEE